VITDENGDELARANDYIGVATNNVAEYRALLLGLERARSLGAREVTIVNDSQLVERQLSGAYRVKNADLRPLHERALAALGQFDRWIVRSVPRAENELADALVNEAIDARAATVEYDGSSEGSL
jgi:ribonuclease HI